MTLTSAQFVPTSHLDGKHVVFGEVSNGHEIIKAMEKKSLDQSGRTSGTIKIKDCGPDANSAPAPRVA